ncbi:MAG: hypothetical protein PHP06_00010 [Clostridia bacterium]|nr:hypothetical protein [Clostridia bacterium]
MIIYLLPDYDHRDGIIVHIIYNRNKWCKIKQRVYKSDDKKHRKWKLI